jgi:hypothetical protein
MAEPARTPAQARRIARILRLWDGAFESWAITNTKPNRIKVTLYSKSKGDVTWDIGPRGGIR